MGRWLSQHPGEQKTNLTRPVLQVLTAHRMTLAPTAIGLRHIEHTKAGALDRGFSRRLFPKAI